MPFLNYNFLKLQSRVFLVGNTIAMVAYYAREKIATSSPMAGQICDNMIVASRNKEWLKRPINI